MSGRWTTMAAILGFLAVVLGAFGAHGLKMRVEPDRLTVFETGVRFQMYHALALGLASWVVGSRPSRAATAACTFFLIGVFLFSGSLYALTLVSWRWLGPITPLGGTCLLIGWALLALATRRPRVTRRDSP